MEDNITNEMVIEFLKNGLNETRPIKEINKIDDCYHIQFSDNEQDLLKIPISMIINNGNKIENDDISLNENVVDEDGRIDYLQNEIQNLKSIVDILINRVNDLENIYINNSE